MSGKKKIVGIKIVDAGSNPDIDSDFNKVHRDDAINYVTELYGKDNVANINTFNTLAAKGAVKSMCTIYQVPFAQANKITQLIPPPMDGKVPTLSEMFDPDSDWYNASSEFRAATSGEDWEKIIEGAKNIEGRNYSLGVHASGIIISQQPLHSAIPLQVRQKDGRVITQWTYKECENLGLIKMDFLGLDTVDIIQNSVDYIMKSGKTPPNMVEMSQGEMDDPETLKLFQEAKTIGIFQFGSEMVRAFLKQMKPTSLNDLAAATSLARPGPMGTQSHIKYADRKNGRAEIEQIHKEFEGGQLEELLEETHGILIFQEQVMKIANQLAGFTLQEADDLRSAMGKKKKAVMDKMEPKFLEGVMSRGYSMDAAQTLWNTIAEFAKYAFNKSHAVAYAMMSYQAGYLKAHYPSEFMSALIAQQIDKKDKVLMYLQEARDMKLKVRNIDINISDVRVAPDFTGTSGYDIIFGLSGAKGVSETTAEIIINERNQNGPYKSVADVINRCVPLGVANKTIYENLAKSGAFDSMNVSRKKVVDNISILMGEAKNKGNMGESLFDFTDVEDNTEIDLSGEDYPYVTKLQHEGNTTGLYLTGNPLDYIKNVSSHSISDLLKRKTKANATIIGSLISIESRNTKRGKSISFEIDDNTGYLLARASKKVSQGVEKAAARENLKKLYIRGENKVPKRFAEIVSDTNIRPISELEENGVYELDITFFPSDNGGYNATVTDIRNLTIGDNGRLPLRIRYKISSSNKNKMRKIYSGLPKALAKKFPGDIPIIQAHYSKLPEFDSSDAVYAGAVRDIEEGVVDRSWPPKPEPVSNPRKYSESELVNRMKYRDTGYTTNRSSNCEQFIEKYLGYEAYDWGIPSNLGDD